MKKLKEHWLHCVFVQPTDEMLEVASDKRDEAMAALSDGWCFTLTTSCWIDGIVLCQHHIMTMPLKRIVAGMLLKFTLIEICAIFNSPGPDVFQVFCGYKIYTHCNSKGWRLS